MFAFVFMVISAGVTGREPPPMTSTKSLDLLFHFQSFHNKYLDNKMSKNQSFGQFFQKVQTKNSSDFLRRLHAFLDQCV